MAESILTPTTPDTSALFEPFQWHRKETENASLPGEAVMRFASEAQDISNGARTILEILERDNLMDHEEGRKLFNDNVRGSLLRMAITSLSQLSDSSDHLIDWAYKYHTAEGRAEQP